MASFVKRLGLVKTRSNGSSDAHESSDGHNGSDGVDEKIESTAYATTTAVRTQDELEANKTLREIRRKHRWDPNLPEDLAEGIDEATAHHDAKEELGIVQEVVEDSPYPEVRAVARNWDEELPVNTLRAWVLGMLLTTIASGMNALFSLRAPVLTITGLVVQLVAYPLGLGWAKFLPRKEFRVFGRSFSINPGPFNVKEHTLITVMATVNVAGGVAYATDIIVAQRGFYKQDYGWGFDILLCISTQAIGYGLAGMFRKYLVFPAAMIWPTALVNVSLLYGLHDHSKTDPAKHNGWSISRYRYFLYVFVGSFVWYWFPGFIAPFLSVFAFPTWIRPDDVVVNQIFGGWSGLSLLPLTFDWTQISSYAYSPLIPPAHTIINVLIGMVVFFWITTLGVHYSGGWYARFLPMSDSQSYDNTGSLYNVTKILTPEGTLDLAKYQEYSPLFLSTTFALTYGLSFASLSALIAHTGLFHGKELWEQTTNLRSNDEDVHYRMMKKYKEAPFWWYAALFIVMLGLSFATVLAWPTGMAAWALVLTLIIAIVWFLPIGIIQGMTSIQLGLNVLTEFVAGYVQPGNPMSMMLFKNYGYICMAQGLYFAQDLKLGQYMKVPPRLMFAGQLVATLWASVVQVAVTRWGLDSVDGICTRHQVNNFTCPNGRVFFNASVIWGLIGPQRIFSPGSIYGDLQWFWLAGVLLPVAIYVAARVWPRSRARYLNAPLIFGGSGMIPPATPLNYLSWGAVGLFFNPFLRRKYRGWWMRFNYLTSAGLDVGLAVCTIVIILTLNLTNTSFPEWWGVTVAANNLDYQDSAVQAVVGDGEIFGPATW